MNDNETENSATNSPAEQTFTESYRAIDKLVAEGTDEEVLEAYFKFFHRVTISSQFISNDDDLLTHEVLAVRAGDAFILSEPQELEWPLQRLPMPEAFNGKFN